MVEDLHKCTAVHHQTVPVHLRHHLKTLWEGDVEVYALHGHPEASRAYAWNHKQSWNDQRERFVVVLGIPPVDSACYAVKYQIVKDVNSGYSKLGFRRVRGD